MSEPFIFNKKGHCNNCKGESTWVLYRQLAQNESVHFLWQCSRCNTKNPDRKPPLYIPKALIESKLTPEQIAELPLLMPSLYTRCAVCGNRATEMHHWAPRGIFGDDCENWPKDYLCKDHHEHWHRAVTPQLTTDRDLW
jgi:hypothetical protein